MKLCQNFQQETNVDMVEEETTEIQKVLANKYIRLFVTIAYLILVLYFNIYIWTLYIIIILKN